MGRGRGLADYRDPVTSGGQSAAVDVVETKSGPDVPRISGPCVIRERRVRRRNAQLIRKKPLPEGGGAKLTFPPSLMGRSIQAS